MTPEQKIEAEAEKLYPYLAGFFLNGQSHDSINRDKRAAYIAGRSAGLEREKELEEALIEMRKKFNKWGISTLHDAAMTKADKLINKK